MIPKPIWGTYGKVSSFGGPGDSHISLDSGLALYWPANKHTAPEGMFLPETQIHPSWGLARQLNPDFPYVAARWEYIVTPKSFLRDFSKCLVIIKNQQEQTLRVYPVDWGPHKKTNRVADVSPVVMKLLNLKTDDLVWLNVFEILT